MVIRVRFPPTKIYYIIYLKVHMAKKKMERLFWSRKRQTEIN